METQLRVFHFQLGAHLQNIHSMWASSQFSPLFDADFYFLIVVKCIEHKTCTFFTCKVTPGASQ